MGRKKGKWWKRHHKQKVESTVVTPPAPKVVIPSYPCHEGIIPVFEDDGLKIWGGKAWEIMGYDDWALMVLFTDRTSQWEHNEPSPFINSNARARRILPPEIFRVQNHAPYIAVDWEDYGVPELDKEWWVMLLESLYKLPKPANVAFGCTGGHGRTGTALSILWGLANPTTTRCPVAMVRNRHCYKAVESQRQLDYVEKITGLKVRAMPNWVKKEPAPVYDYWANTGVVKDADEEVEPDVAEDSDQPVMTNSMSGKTYRPRMNAAGDVIGWDEVKDVAL